MIELKTVLELAKELKPWKVAQKTGYTTAQVLNILKLHNQEPFYSPKPNRKVPRVQGDRRVALIAKIRAIQSHKLTAKCSTKEALAALPYNMSVTQVNRWIVKLTDTGEL